MILLTGSTGFIGKSMCKKFEEKSISFIAPVRSIAGKSTESAKLLKIDSITSETDWSVALKNVNTVIHLAAYVHTMSSSTTSLLSEYRKVNTAGTLNLAKQAAQSGVVRFIFLSTIKVNGEYSLENKPFIADDVNIPTDPYALSKYEAEHGLRELAAKTGMEVVIIRPPLVYGPGVKGNFQSMIKLLSKGYPLPFGSVRNMRSLVAVDNLTDLIIRCVDHPAAANRIFLASDGEDISTTELLIEISKALEKPNRLIPIPQSILEIALRIFGKKEIAIRLFGNLQVDITETTQVLDWKPVVGFEKAVKNTVQEWLKVN